MENTRGRKKGQVIKQSPKGYIIINENLRIEIEPSNITLQECGEGDKEIWGNNKYFTSWKGLLDYLIRKQATENLSKKEVWTFTEARTEWINSIKEVQTILVGEIDKQVKIASEEVKNSIKKFNI